MGPIIAAIAESLPALLESGAVQASTLNKLGSKFSKVDKFLGLGPKPQLDKDQQKAADMWSGRLGAIGDKFNSISQGVQNVAAGDGPILSRGGKVASDAGEFLTKQGMPVLGTFAQAAGALAQSVEKLQSWNNSLLAADLKFAQSSNSMAGVEAAKEYRDERYNTERGERRAATSAEFNQKTGRLDRQLGEVEDWFHTSMEKYVAGPLSTVASAALGAVGFEGKIENNTDTSIEQWMGGWMAEDPKEAMRQIESRRPKHMGGNQ